MMRTTARSLSRSAVLAGVDGSNGSLAAVRWAAEEAAARDTTLLLMCTVPFVEPGSLSNEHASALLAVAREEASRHVRSVQIAAQVSAGPVVPTLVAASARVALVVLGVAGCSGDTDVLLGSTTLAVSGQTACPLVGVRRWPLPETADAPVVLGLGDVAVDAAAVEVAFQRAHRRRSGLVVVHTDEVVPGRDSDERIVGELAAWRRRYRDVPVRFRFPRERPEAALLEGARHGESIVTGSRRRGPAARALLGSTSRDVLRYSPVPVIVVTPGPVARAAPAERVLARPSARGAS